MRIVRLLGVWSAAVLISILATGSWVALQHIDDGSPASIAALLREALPVLGLIALCQVGLVLAPIARQWRWPSRVFVGLLMVPTLFVTLAVGYQQLSEAAFWGWLVFRRVDSIWVPVLLLYVVQLGRLLRGAPPLEQSRAGGLTIAVADKVSLL